MADTKKTLVERLFAEQRDLEGVGVEVPSSRIRVFGLSPATLAVPATTPRS